MEDLGVDLTQFGTQIVESKLQLSTIQAVLAFMLYHNSKIPPA
jgi:hypothetical protein